MKTCKYCDREKPDHQFCKGRNVCRLCHNEKYGRQRYRTAAKFRVNSDLTANPHYTLNDYSRAFPLHPMDKYGRK